MMRHQFAAGLPIVRVLRQQAERGPPVTRAMMGRVQERVEAGEALGAAFAHEQAMLPPLFLAMVQLADETGHLPEVLEELERYFTLEQSLRRQFRNQSILPVIQFVFAIFIVAGLILILGMLAGSGKPLMSFFGLSGGPGALAFLASVAGVIVSIALLWQVLRSFTRQKASVDRLVLRVPVLGPTLEALLMGRLALALQLTLDSGLAITRALRLSLRATGNAAYSEAADRVVRMLKDGNTLYEALALVRLFPEEFMQIIAAAEEAGRVPEAMRQQAEYYYEEAARRLKLLAQAASFGLWLLYAAFMVFMIFRIASVYLNALGI
jgi:type II secretory pathway component PulF